MAFVCVQNGCLVVLLAGLFVFNTRRAYHGQGPRRFHGCTAARIPERRSAAPEEVRVDAAHERTTLEPTVTPPPTTSALGTSSSEVVASARPPSPVVQVATSSTSTLPPGPSSAVEDQYYVSPDGVLREEHCTGDYVGEGDKVALSSLHDLRSQQHVIGPVSYGRTSIAPHAEIATYVPGIDDNFVSSSILRDGCWECGLVNLVKNAVQKYPAAFFLDAGANLGMYSLTVAGMKRQVFAFEPFFTTRIRLCKSIQRNGFHQYLHLFRKGLSRENGKKFEFRGMSNKNPGGVSINEAPGAGGILAQLGGGGKFPKHEEGVTWAESIRLSDYLDVFASKQILPGADMVMKMDIEGHECQAVEGMADVLRRFTLRFVLMEWGQMYGDAAKMALHHLDRFCPTIKQLVGLLLEKGLYPSTVSGHRLNPSYPTHWDGVGDVVWEPNANPQPFPEDQGRNRRNPNPNPASPRSSGVQSSGLSRPNGAYHSHLPAEVRPGMTTTRGSRGQQQGAGNPSNSNGIMRRDISGRLVPRMRSRDEGVSANSNLFGAAATSRGSPDVGRSRRALLERMAEDTWQAIVQNHPPGMPIVWTTSED